MSSYSNIDKLYIFQKTKYRMKTGNLIIIALLFTFLSISYSYPTFDEYMKMFNKTYSEQELPIR